MSAAWTVFAVRKPPIDAKTAKDPQEDTTVSRKLEGVAHGHATRHTMGGRPNVPRLTQTGIDDVSKVATLCDLSPRSIHDDPSINSVSLIDLTNVINVIVLEFVAFC